VAAKWIFLLILVLRNHRNKAELCRHVGEHLGAYPEFQGGLRVLHEIAAVLTKAVAIPRKLRQTTALS